MKDRRLVGVVLASIFILASVVLMVTCGTDSMVPYQPADKQAASEQAVSEQPADSTEPVERRDWSDSVWEYIERDSRRVFYDEATGVRVMNRRGFRFVVRDDLVAVIHRDTGLIVLSHYFLDIASVSVSFPLYAVV